LTILALAFNVTCRASVFFSQATSVIAQIAHRISVYTTREWRRLASRE